jgi:predicted enzyme related to lactoylglutathione lyase
MPRPIHFEIPADHPERAVTFYQQLFGWQFQKWDGPMPYWLVRTGDGKAEAAGGTVALPKMAVPGVGWLAYCLDPEGNTFGLMQRDPEAG